MKLYQVRRGKRSKKDALNLAAQMDMSSLLRACGRVALLILLATACAQSQVPRQKDLNNEAEDGAKSEPSESTFSQTRLLVGTNAGSSFGNLFASFGARIEQPIGKRFELDASDFYAPFEQHIALGNGWANVASGGGIVWLGRNWGMNGNLSLSQYHVQIAKHAPYLLAGISLRRSLQSLPLRLTFDYVRELSNGVSSNGTESSHLQGGEFNLDVRIKCAGPLCWRLAFDFQVGRVAQQSNPACDGQGVRNPALPACPNNHASAGAFTSSLMMEWPRRKETEDLSF